MSLLRILFFYFIVYSFLGWLIEGFYNLITRGSFIKANFLMLPLKPMYGIAAVLLILAQSVFSFWLFLVSLFIIPSAVEYLTGFLLFYIFKLKYWDYSHMPCQLSGYICLRFSIYWVLLSLLLLYLIHPMVISFMLLTSWFWFYFFPVMLILLLTDICISAGLKYRHAH